MQQIVAQGPFVSGHPDESCGFEGFRALYAAGSEIGVVTERFTAQVRTVPFDGLLLVERDYGGLTHTRDARRVRRDGFEHVSAQLLIAGEMLGGPLGEERALSPGDVVVFDVTRPQRTVIERAHTLTVSLGRGMVEKLVPNLAQRHGAILRAGASGLLTDLMHSLLRRRAGPAAASAMFAAGAVAHLLACAMGETRAAAAEVVETQREHRLNAYIDDHLGDPALNADSAASALGMSRRTLDRCACSLGGFQHALLSRRLARIRAELRRTDEFRPVNAIAFASGFTSESHCSRAFKAAYGMPPGEYRTLLRHPGAVTAAPADTDSLAPLYRQLH